MDENVKHHHQLISGEVIFTNKKDETQAINGIRLNGVLITDRQDLPVRSLGKAQQILQLNFHNKMQDEDIEVLDVILHNFVYLGHFTKAEFEATPEGTKVQEKEPAKAPTLSLVPAADGGVANISLEEAVAASTEGANDAGSTAQ